MLDRTNLKLKKTFHLHHVFQQLNRNQFQNKKCLFTKLSR